MASGLSDFVFSYPKLRTQSGEPDLERTHERNWYAYVLKYRRYRWLLELLDRLPVSSIGDPGKANILFVGGRFLELMRAVRRVFNPIGILLGKRDRLNFIKYRIPYVASNRWQSDLFWIYQEPKFDLQEQYLRRLISTIRFVLNYWKPAAVVLGNDSLPLERMIIYGARESNIPSVTIQDGVFQSKSDPRIIHGHSTDYMLVWGKFFKELFVAKHIIPADRLYVLGYPFRIRKDNTRHRQNHTGLGVCFLGQPFEKSNRDYLAVKGSVVRNVLQACQALSIPLFYRLHPGEHRSDVTAMTGNIHLTPRGEDLHRFFNNYDIFFSITSTALVEASLRGKMSAQILVESIPMDDYEKLGICYTLPNSREAIEDFLRAVIEGRKVPAGVSSDYIYRPDDPHAVFLDIMENIRSKQDRWQKE